MATAFSLPTTDRLLTAPRAVPVPVPRAAVNNTDSFGQTSAPVGAPLQQARPVDPNDQPNPANPGGISNNELARRQTALRTASDRTAANNATYNAVRGQENLATQTISNTAPTHRAQIELPYLGEIPGIGNTLEGAFSGAQRGALAFGDEAVSNPGLTLATGGTNAIYAGADSLADDVATGVTRDVTGNERAYVDLPLTPGQILSPNNPLYTDSSGTNINLPGLDAILGGGGNNNPDPGSVGNFTGGGGAGRPESALVGGNARTVAGGIAGMNAAGNAGVSSLQQQIQSGQGAFATGGGSGGIQAVDAALTGYNPNFSTPGTGQMGNAPAGVTIGAMPGQVQLGALPGQVRFEGDLPNPGFMGALPDAARMSELPGTGTMSALPGTVGMGALPGATERDLQLSALDRVLGYNPATSSVAERQLIDAGQRNLSNSLALARSARGGPAAQAQALRMAQAEGAATMSETGRNLAILRATEEAAAKERELKALGLGGDISSGIRTSDVGERGQNIAALEAALAGDVSQRAQTIGALETERQAGVNERGQTIGALEAALAGDVAQRGQTVGALETERTAGVAERGQTIGAREAMLAAAVTQRGQTIGALEAELMSGTTQRGQDVGALEAELAGGVAQRGQTIEQQVAERNAGVSERGQDITAQTAMSQRELDAIMGRGDLAQTERNAGVAERGQTISAATSLESIKQARDAVTSSALTDAEKTESLQAMERARLGYEETPAEREYFMRLQAKLGLPSPLQQGMAVAQGIAGLVTALGAVL